MTLDPVLWTPSSGSSARRCIMTDSKYEAFHGVVSSSGKLYIIFLKPWLS